MRCARRRDRDRRVDAVYFTSDAQRGLKQKGRSWCRYQAAVPETFPAFGGNAASLVAAQGGPVLVP